MPQTHICAMVYTGRSRVVYIGRLRVAHIGRLWMVHIGRLWMAHIGRLRVAHIMRLWVAHTMRSRMDHYSPVNDNSGPHIDGVSCAFLKPKIFRRYIRAFTHPILLIECYSNYHSHRDMPLSYCLISELQVRVM